MTTTQRVRTTDGLPLAVHSYGDPTAPTVLCVHGYPDNSAVWDHVVAHLRDRYHVVTYDVRGAGLSPAPKQRSGYHLDQLTDDLARVATTVSPAAPVHLLGHDWGSVQSWHAVTDIELAPKFASFTSISGPCLDHIAHWMRSDPQGAAHQAVRSSYIGFFQMPVLPELSWLSGAGNLVLGALERLAEQGGDDGSRRELRDYLNGINLYRVNMGRQLTDAAKRHTDVPTQVLVPTREVFMTEAAQTAAAAWTSDFRFHRVSGGHWLPRSQPAAVARYVDELAVEVTGGGRSSLG